MTLGLTDLPLPDLERLLDERCKGNPLNGEWGDLYDDLLGVVRRFGSRLNPGSRAHRLVVAAAAVHYMRYDFQSVGSFWGGFCQESGVIREPVYDVLHAWLIDQGISVIQKSGHRLVVQTLLSVTGVPVHWNRDFADFFQWFWRQGETISAQEAWKRYPGAKHLIDRESSFCPSADRLRRAFNFLLEEDLTWDADPTELCDLDVAGLGPEYDPRRLVRRRDSFGKLWRDLFTRLTLGQFRRWLRAHPEEWVTSPLGTSEAARRLYVRDDICYGVYRRTDGNPLDVLPHQRISLRQMAEEWPWERPWRGSGNLVGFKSRKEFHVSHNGIPYGRSRQTVIDGNQFHTFLTELPLGGTLSINGQNVPCRTGLEWGGLEFWLDRQEDTYTFGLEVGHITAALPKDPYASLVISVELGVRVISSCRNAMDRTGAFERTGIRLVIADPAAGPATCRLEVGTTNETRGLTLPPVMLFTGGGEWVPPRERSVPFGGRHYTLLLADGQPDPAFDPDKVEVTWTSARCGQYRVGKVKWREGAFYLTAGPYVWRSERCVTVALALMRMADPPSLESVSIEWPGNVYERFCDFEIRLISSFQAPPAGLTLHLFRHHMPVARIRLEPKDLRLKLQVHQEYWWEVSQEPLAALRDEAGSPGAYELILKAEDQVLSRYRFFLIPQVRVKGRLQPQPEGSIGALALHAPGPVLLAPGGVAERTLSLPVPFRTHEVANGQAEIRCYPEPFRTTVTCIHPQVTLPVVVTPTACGFRAFRTSGGKLSKVGVVEYEYLAETKLSVFGPQRSQVDVMEPSGRRILRLQLSDDGQGQFESLSELVPYCTAPLQQFSLRFSLGAVVPLQVRWAPRVRNVVLPPTFDDNSNLECKFELSAPSETSLEVVGLNHERRHAAILTEKSLANRWRRITARLSGAGLRGQASWYVLLLVNGQRQVLGLVWNQSEVEGGVGGLDKLPIAHLPDAALSHLREWSVQSRTCHTVLWAPIPSVRKDLLEAAKAALRGAEVYWPTEAGRQPAVGDLTWQAPLEWALASGVALGGKIGVVEAMAILRRRELPPLIVPEAHELSVYERLLLRKMPRKICLISATFIPSDYLG